RRSEQHVWLEGARKLDQTARLLRRLVVEQKYVRARLDSVAQVALARDLDLDLVQVADGFPGALDRRRHAARQRDVVVLDEHAVVQAEAVVARAARQDRVLLKHAEARSGLSRVNYLRARALDGADELARQ